MKKTSQFEADAAPLPNMNDYPVRCTACRRHCVIYVLANSEPLPTDPIVIDENKFVIGEDCPIPNE